MKFIKSVTNSKDFINDKKKEICFIGRSNVGKSSLINALANNKNLAKTSSTPGRTQLINLFEDENYRLVDLPGYGFAKLPKWKRLEIKEMIEDYIVNAKNLFAVFQICDANVLTELDANMANYLKQNIKNFYVVMNKIDKNNINKYINNLDKIENFLRVNKKDIIMVSAKNKKNIDLLRKKIYSIINEQ